MELVLLYCSVNEVGTFYMNIYCFIVIPQLFLVFLVSPFITPFRSIIDYIIRELFKILFYLNNSLLLISLFNFYFFSFASFLDFFSSFSTFLGAGIACFLEKFSLPLLSSPRHFTTISSPKDTTSFTSFTRSCASSDT